MKSFYFLCLGSRSNSFADSMKLLRMVDFVYVLLSYYHSSLFLFSGSWDDINGRPKRFRPPSKERTEALALYKKMVCLLFFRSLIYLKIVSLLQNPTFDTWKSRLTSPFFGVSAIL
jgi:hypothetical protein